MLSLGWAENGKKQLIKQFEKHQEKCASSTSPSDDGLWGDSVLPGEGTKPKLQVRNTEVRKNTCSTKLHPQEFIKGMKM